MVSKDVVFFQMVLMRLIDMQWLKCVEFYVVVNLRLLFVSPQMSGTGCRRKRSQSGSTNISSRYVPPPGSADRSRFFPDSDIRIINEPLPAA